MRHFFLVDPFEKLWVEFDTSLLLASVMKKMGAEVYFLFEKDLHFQNEGPSSFSAYPFESFLDEELYQLKSCVLKNETRFIWQEGDVLHMRLDPPFDSRYLRVLWMLKALQKKGITVVNDPAGIMLYNEKLFAYEQKESCPSLVGSSLSAFKVFVSEMKQRNYEALILKPLDLYQGKGVERLFLKDYTDTELEEKFLKKSSDLKGPLVVQPYLREVEKGEIRATYFMGDELGSVLKHPKKGDYLANMMSTRARCEKIILTEKQKSLCSRIAKELSSYGVHWIAFDLLGDTVSEVNITCPGLMGETCKEHQTNLFAEMVRRAKWL